MPRKRPVLKPSWRPVPIKARTDQRQPIQKILMELSKAPEMVIHPAHYGGDTLYEVIKVLEAWELGFHLGNAVKYIARAGKKHRTSELEDLKKARWYLERRIANLEKANDDIRKSGS